MPKVHTQVKEAATASAPADIIPFEDAVRECKQIRARIEGRNEDTERDHFRIGEIADKVEKTKYGDRTYAKLAERSNIAYSCLKRYLSVNRAWKGTPFGAPGPQSVSYSVLRELAALPEVAGLPNRVQIVRDNPDITKREAEQLRRERKKGTASSTAQQQAQSSGQQQGGFLKDKRGYLKDVCNLAEKLRKKAEEGLEATDEQLDDMAQVAGGLMRRKRQNMCTQRQAFRWRLEMPVLDWAYWDFSWNPLGGCLPVDRTCDNCYAAQCAGTKSWPFEGYAGVHDGVTVKRGKKRVFNGKATRARDKHPLWTKPLRLKGAKVPKLGSGKRSICFVEDMGDLFFEKHSDADITRVIETVVLSGHIGLLLTKRPTRMAKYFLRQSPLTVRQWQPNLWLGFSAGDQEWFDRRLPDLLALAEAGWFVFVSISPMYQPVILPPEFLALGKRHLGDRRG